VRASVGVAVANRWHTTELLLHDADQAMYQAKHGPDGPDGSDDPDPDRPDGRRASRG
jgi:GGDEF domain-containing protein